MNNIKAEYSSYSAIVNKIGESKIHERLCAIHDVYSDFLKATGYKDEKDVFLNDRLLMHAIMDYFTDITRLKNFHDIKLINQDKIISYECSWMLKRKPIQVLRIDKEELLYVNEKFILGILVNHLVSEEIDDLSNYSELESFCDTLLYYLKFRHCNPKILEMVITAFKAGNSLSKIEYN